jgi:propionyl-CoA carboxylase beta chain
VLLYTAAAAQEPYDMRDVLAEVVDDRYVFEMIPDYARNVISGFARLGGETVGIIANNPLVLAGVLDMDAAIKASRCVWVCLVFARAGGGGGVVTSGFCHH